MEIFYNVLPLFFFLAIVVFAIYYIIIFAKDSQKRLDQNEKIIKLLEEIRDKQNKS